MYSNRQHGPQCPFAYELEAYALGALEDSQREELELHLRECNYCASVLSELQATTELLAATVPQAPAPPALAIRIAEAVDNLPPVFVPPAAAEDDFVAQEPASRFSYSAFALPMVASIIIGLLSAALILNVVNNPRLNSLQEETLHAEAELEAIARGFESTALGLTQLAQAGQQTDSVIKQVMEASQLMALPFAQPLLLLPTQNGSPGEGVLLVNDDGKMAILMLVNMDPSMTNQAYQVWLTRNGQRVSMGSIFVSSSGSGTLALNPPESLYGYDWMNLTVDNQDAGSGNGNEMVLQTKLMSPGYQ